MALLGLAGFATVVVFLARALIDAGSTTVAVINFIAVVVTLLGLILQAAVFFIQTWRDEDRAAGGINPAEDARTDSCSKRFQLLGHAFVLIGAAYLLSATFL